MHYKQILAGTGMAAALFVSTALPVFADGNQEIEYREECTTVTLYGGGTEKQCKKVEVKKDRPTETIVTETETGIVENMAIATGLFVAGYALMIAAQKQARI